jgi:hypothetical protein
LALLSGADPYIVVPFLAAVINLVTVGTAAASTHDHSCERIGGVFLIYQLWVCSLLSDCLSTIEGFFTDDAFVGVFYVLPITIATIQVIALDSVIRTLLPIITSPMYFSLLISLKMPFGRHRFPLPFGLPASLSVFAMVKAVT